MKILFEYNNIILILMANRGWLWFWIYKSIVVLKKKTINLLMPEGLRNILFLISSDFCFE
jgi:hypothetical protein